MKPANQHKRNMKLTNTTYRFVNVVTDLKSQPSPCR